MQAVFFKFVGWVQQVLGDVQISITLPTEKKILEQVKYNKQQTSYSESRIRLMGPS